MAGSKVLTWDAACGAGKVIGTSSPKAADSSTLVTSRSSAFSSLEAENPSRPLRTTRTAMPLVSSTLLVLNRLASNSTVVASFRRLDDLDLLGLGL